MCVCVRVHLLLSETGPQAVACVGVCICVWVCTSMNIHFIFVYAEPTVADDSKMKDSGVNAEALIDSEDLTRTYTECTSGIYEMLQVTSTTIPPLLLCVRISSCWQ